MIGYVLVQHRSIREIGRGGVGVLQYLHRYVDAHLNSVRLGLQRSLIGEVIKLIG